MAFSVYQSLNQLRGRQASWTLKVMQERILCSQGKASKDIAPQSREIFTDVCMVAGGGGGGESSRTCPSPYKRLWISAIFRG